MKFLHAADIHLDGISSGLKSYYGSEQLSISQAIQQAFERLIDTAIQERVDFILFPGDLFDSNWKDYSLGLFFIEQINRVSCPIYYIRGNHDAENRLLKQLDYPPHFFDFSAIKPQTYLLDSLKVAIHGVSYATYRTEEDLSIHYPEAISGYFNIGLLHSSGNIKQEISSYAPFKLETLKMKGYDYWALGHIHNYQIVETSPYIVYSGNIQGRHIHERGSKGCCLVSRVNGNLELEFKSLANLIWERVTLNLSNIVHERELKVTLSQLLTEKYGEQMRDGVSFVFRVYLTGLLKQGHTLNLSQEYLESQIHSWIQEFSGKKGRLEKVENETRSIQSMERIKEENPLIEAMLSGAEESFHMEETKMFFQQCLSDLKSRAPEEYKRKQFVMDLEEMALYEVFIQRVKDEIQKKFLEEEQ